MEGKLTMQETESFITPEFKDIEYHLAAAARTLSQLKLYDYMDRLEELMGDLEEEALRQYK